MTRQTWADLLTERDERIIEAAGYAEGGADSWESRGLGDSPVVLVVDMQRKNAGDDVPILEAIEQYRTAMGEVAWDTAREIESFLEHARANDVPVIYTRSIPASYDGPTHEALDIVEPLAPQEGDPVIDKAAASPFSGTNIVSHLVRRKADTLVLVGATTSGCIRATAVDATANGYNVVVPQECVFDRIQVSHEIGLLDLWMKYAEVVELSEAETYLAEVSGGR